jgi:site-specific DNA-methyltransferase (adenine-specific)
MKIDLHLGDCLDLMPSIADASVDAVICDPPYGTTRNQWDAVIDLPSMWRQLQRLVKPGGAIVFTACQPFASVLVASNLRMFRHDWVWRKNKATGHLNAKRMPMRAHEGIFVFCERAPTYNPQMSEGHAPVNAFYTRRNGDNYGAGTKAAGGGSTTRYPRSVIDFAVVNNDDPARSHPTQKPLSLMEYLVRTYTNEGDVVLDFAMGSGTTGVACRNAARSFIGMEYDPAHFATARDRILASNDNAATISLAAAG